jgi:hypothetical protein
MPLVILPAGLHPIGSAPSSQNPLLPPPVISADGIDEGSKDLASVLYGADPIDDQVYIALNTLRGSGAAVMNVGQRFQDVRKLDDNAAILIEQEGRTALRRLVNSGDITIDRLYVQTDSAGTWAELVCDFINNRLPKPGKRTVRAPLRPEATSR